MKVGKAIYNILSQSTDVQSNFPFNTTDYAPTGTDLVTNGDFSAAGINLVSNPNFTDTGAELITNGDFATSGTPTTTSWSLGWSVVGVDGGGANITGGELVLDRPDGADSNYNRLYATNGSSAITGVVEVGKSYKLTYTVTAVSGSTTFKYIDGGAYADAPSSLGTHVIYYVCTVTANFGVRNSGNDSSITLDNVSVKELGADWTLGDGWSIGDSKAICLADGGYEVLNQGLVLDSGSSYKVTYTADLSLITSGTLKFGAFSNSATDRTVVDGTHTAYLTASGTSFQVNEGGAIGTATITNISVQELGEGWTLGTGWSIGADKLIGSGSQSGYVTQTNIFTPSVNNTYKITLTIADYESGYFDIRTQGNTGVSSQINSNGPKTIYLASGSPTNGTILFSYAGLFVGSITNITVQEMILTKIFPELAPPDIDAPYIVYSVVSNSPSDTKNANGDIDTANIEVYGFQDTYNKAVDLGVSVRAALDRKTGTYNTIEIQSTNYVNEQMDVNEARKLWAAIQDYSIRIKNI